MCVRIGRLEVVAESMEKKFDTFVSYCTTSMSMIEKRQGEIGHIMSQFVDKSAIAKEVELDDPQAAEGHHPVEMADVVFLRLTHINADMEHAFYCYIFDKNFPSERFNVASVQSDIKLWPFKVISGPANKPRTVVNYKGEDKPFVAEEISIVVLINMKENAAEAFHNVVLVGGSTRIPKGQQLL
ncbi:unnamed protein product [Ilex paraguariensis]|uniref:Uncharacterized protein n=1 Tax=Ilex paraguariensis TaxID=185542 RepID=A0ABC8TV74_9AQUA